MVLRKGFITISLPEELVFLIDEIIASDPSYKSRPEFIKEAVRRRLDELRQHPPRFEHINPEADFPSDSVKIWDRQLEQRGRLVEVFFQRGGQNCEHCQKDDCVHIRFAWAIPYVATQLRKHGLKPPKEII